MKTIKFIQVNIFLGTYLDNLLKFLKKENPDFISMQEVSYGNLNKTGNRRQNIFKSIKKVLKAYGAYNMDLKTTGKFPGGFGNAVLSKYKIKKVKIIILNKRQTWKPEDLFNEKKTVHLPRHIIDCVVNFHGRKIHVMSVHGAWTRPPVDTKEKLGQAKLIAKYLRSTKEPYILGGDMNMPPESRTIKIINNASNNLIKGSKIKYTTHPVMHKIAPRKLLVDYIFASNNFNKISIKSPKILISDHLPVIAKLKLLNSI